MLSPQARRRPLTKRALLWRLGLLLAVLVVSVVVGASVGAGDVSLWDVLRGSVGLDSVPGMIIIDVRLPRVLLAAALGAALTSAGVVFQALLRNPLADPYVLGVSGGASIGAVLALAMGFGGGLLGSIAVPGMAFVGALAALSLITTVATVGGRLSVYTVLLTGVIFNAFSGALIYFVQSVASLEQLHSIVFYLMGSVPSYNYRLLAVLASVVVAGAAWLFALARDYNVLSTGEEGAALLGVDVERLKRRSFVVGSLLTGLAVSVGGLIGFVGLVVPHLLRLLLGPDHRILIPAGFLGGASFLILADAISRTVVAPAEIPVGVVTALVGGPFFLVLLRRRGEERHFG